MDFSIFIATDTIVTGKVWRTRSSPGAANAVARPASACGPARSRLRRRRLGRPVPEHEVHDGELRRVLLKRRLPEGWAQGDLQGCGP